MTSFIKLSLTCLMVISLSCDTAKNAATAEDGNSEKTMQMDTETKTNLLNEGYAMGTIKYLKNSKCSYIIIDEKSGVQFDPINIDTDKYSAFKSESTKVYFKYRPLRMANRCMEAQPIELEDMKTR